MKFSQRPGLAAFANHRPLSPFEERCFRLEQGLPVSRPVPTDNADRLPDVLAAAGGPLQHDTLIAQGGD